MRTVCGLDVHKDSIFVCILNEKGILFQDKIGVLTPDLERLVDVLHEHGATEVCMESTSIYWMPVWRILEPYFSLKLVNPYFIKQLPGKKSDVKDAEWIATCLLKDLIRGSYVPEDRIQQLRQYDRRIFDLNKDIVYKLTKLDAALQRCNIRISNYVSTTEGKSYQKVVEKIAEGIYVGYRYFQTADVEVSYPFGYGLSYTTFAYSKPVVKATADGFTATITVTNTGKVAGKEAVQLFVTAPEGGLEKPAFELKAFAKTKALAPGESQTLTMNVDAYTLASFNEATSSWETAAGTYDVKFAANAADVRATAQYKQKKAQSWKVNDVLAPEQPVKELSLKK